MGTGFWSNGCRGDVEYLYYPGQGSYLRSRYGTWWVPETLYTKYGQEGWECRYMGPPCKAYGWISEANGCRGAYGQWFVGGYIAFWDGAWRVGYGNYGQTGGLRGVLHAVRRRMRQPKYGVDPELPPGHPFTDNLPPTLAA